MFLGRWVMAKERKDKGAATVSNAIQKSHVRQWHVRIVPAGLRMNLPDALAAVVKVLDLKKEQHLPGGLRVLPKMFQVHALFGMVGSIFFELLFDVGQFDACEFCQYVRHV